jgi:predicted nucleic-acid-binding protein
VVAHLLGSKNIVFERSEIVAQALDLSDGQDIELPDAIIAAINRDESCTHTVTFDERFASSGAATLLK